VVGSTTPELGGIGIFWRLSFGKRFRQWADSHLSREPVARLRVSWPRHSRSRRIVGTNSSLATSRGRIGIDAARAGRDARRLH
jgi:hypothetical protein